MSPDEVTAIVQAIRADARRLGLVWRIRPGTVETTDGENAIGSLDGDGGVLIPMINLVGAVAGERVFVIEIPEGGNYIIGRPGQAALVDRVDSVANSAAVGAEAVVLTSNSITFMENAAYRAVLRGATQSSASASAVYRIRQTNLSGTILHVTQDLGNTTGFTQYDEMVIGRGVGSGDLVDNLVLTLQAGSGTVTMLGNTAFVRYLEVWRLPGTIANYPNAILI